MAEKYANVKIKVDDHAEARVGAALARISLQDWLASAIRSQLEREKFLRRQKKAKSE